jgi:hypothetical protein
MAEPLEWAQSACTAGEFVYSGAPEARYVYRFFRYSAPAPEERPINGSICRSSGAGDICLPFSTNITLLRS